jgi:predicted PurR-regulated permease PerM
MLTRRVVEIFGPSEEIRTRVGSVLKDMATQVRTYIVWRTIINFGLAIVMGLVYQFAGLQQAWTWAILLAILNYVPYLGPLVAGIPPFVDAFLTTTPAGAVVVSIVYVVVIMLEGWLVVPLLMGRSMDLNATTVMLACLFWDLVWGMTGLFLAMPIMAGVKAILYHVPEWRVWANLMSTDRGEPEGALAATVPDASPANGAAASSTFTNASP